MAVDIQATPQYDQLMATLFRGGIGNGEGQIVAVTSANRGEGATYVANSIAARLTKHPLNRVAVIRAQSLPEYRGVPSSIGTACSMPNGTNIYGLTGAKETYSAAPGESLWEVSPGHRRECIQQLRRRFTHILIDCLPPRASGDVYSLAPLVDGFVLVVEANKTKKSQILNLERAIQAAHGQITGYVVNKREYLIPQWLYSRL